MCPGAFSVMLVVMADAHDGRFSKGAGYISRLTGFSIPKIYRCLGALERAGYLTNTGQRTLRNRRLVYNIALDAFLPRFGKSPQVATNKSIRTDAKNE